MYFCPAIKSPLHLYVDSRREKGLTQELTKRRSGHTQRGKAAQVNTSFCQEWPCGVTETTMTFTSEELISSCSSAAEQLHDLEQVPCLPDPHSAPPVVRQGICGEACRFSQDMLWERAVGVVLFSCQRLIERLPGDKWSAGIPDFSALMQRSSSELLLIVFQVAQFLCLSLSWKLPTIYPFLTTAFKDIKQHTSSFVFEGQPLRQDACWLASL